MDPVSPSVSPKLPSSQPIVCGDGDGCSGGGGDGFVTTVTFEERDGKTYLMLRDRYPSKEALDEALASGSISGYPEQFDELAVLLKNLQ